MVGPGGRRGAEPPAGSPYSCGVSDLHFLPATELSRLLAEREVSSRELLDTYLDRIDRLDGEVNAVVALDVERARRRAEAADAAIVAGRSWGPLHGLPMTIKDAYETEGLVTTSGAPELRDHVPTLDADPVARLKGAGAVVFGKTNLPLYAGDVQTFNDVYGVTHNPWDTSRTPGGSSGGAAAALAAGFTGFELGSDIGGSIRNPAHFCGVFGLKPTWGVVSGRGHIPGPPGALGVADVGVHGPMGRSTADLTLGLDVLAGPTSVDATAWRLDLPPARHDGRLEGLRVACWFEDAAAPITTGYADTLTAAASALATDGAAVSMFDPPASIAALARLWEQLVISIVGAELPEEVFDISCAVEATPVEDDEPSGIRSARAVALRHRTWLGANQQRQKLRAAFAERFRDIDVVLAPVMPGPAFPHDHGQDLFGRTIDVDGTPRPYDDLFAWNGAIGALLLPVAVPPIGRVDGLPVGVQVIAPHLEDRTALAVAGHLERLLGGFTPPPRFS